MILGGREEGREEGNKGEREGGRREGGMKGKEDGSLTMRLVRRENNWREGGN